MNVRAAGVQVVKAYKNQPFLLSVDIPAMDAQVSSYVAELSSPNGKANWALPISSEAAKNTINIQVPGILTAGSYALIIHAVNANGEIGQEVTRYPFELQLQSR